MQSVLYWLNEACNILYFSYKKYSFICIHFHDSQLLIPLFYRGHMNILGVLAGLKLKVQGTDGVKVVVGEPASLWKHQKCDCSVLCQTLGSFH